jgi:hypothetical protein
VESSRYFGLFLTQFLFSRPFCQKEARRALACCKPIILLRETDQRNGAPDAVPESLVVCPCAVRRAGHTSPLPAAAQSHISVSLSEAPEAPIRFGAAMCWTMAGQCALRRLA